MYLLKLDNITELKRGENPSLYFGIVDKSVVKTIPQLNSEHMVFSECIYINASDVIVKETSQKYKIELINPILISHYPEGEDYSQYPILISQSSGMDIILKSLLNDEVFSDFIEVKFKNVSKNSKKIMTIFSLKNLLENLDIQLSLEQTYELIDDLLIYIHKLIRKNIGLSFLTIREKQSIVEKSVINTPNAWFVYFKYFIDQWYVNKESIEIPDLSEKFSVDGWEGPFFDRDNPIWDSIFRGTYRKHYPSKKVQVKIYQYWTSLKKSSL